jgi:hypothetical protein
MPKAAAPVWWFAIRRALHQFGTPLKLHLVVGYYQCRGVVHHNKGTESQENPVPGLGTSSKSSSKMHKNGLFVQNRHLLWLDLATIAAGHPQLCELP